MSAQLEDILPYLKKKQEQAELKAVDQLRHQAGVGVVMSELQAEPRWGIYANHVQAIKEQWEEKSNAARGRLNGPYFLDEKEYGQLKLDQARAEGMAKGIALALSMATTLIQRGETAMAALGEEKLDMGAQTAL